MAQRENCMGLIWRKEIIFGTNCQVHRATQVYDYQYISRCKMKVKVTPRLSTVLTQDSPCFGASQQRRLMALMEIESRIAGRSSRAFFSGTLESNSSDVTGLTLHAQTYIQKNATLV